MRPRVPEIRAAGGDLVVVGCGSPVEAGRFAERMGLFSAGVTVLSDEALASYRLLGLRHGVLSTLHPRAAVPWLVALARGHRQGNVMGDCKQQGGVVVVGPGGELAYRHSSRDPGDHPAADEVIAALRRACASG